jgi:hypothetical protein
MNIFHFQINSKSVVKICSIVRIPYPPVCHICQKNFFYETTSIFFNEFNERIMQDNNKPAASFFLFLYQMKKSLFKKSDALNVRVNTFHKLQQLGFLTPNY